MNLDRESAEERGRSVVIAEVHRVQRDRTRQPTRAAVPRYGEHLRIEWLAYHRPELGFGTGDGLHQDPEVGDHRGTGQEGHHESLCGHHGAQ